MGGQYPPPPGHPDEGMPQSPSKGGAGDEQKQDEHPHPMEGGHDEHNPDGEDIVPGAVTAGRLKTYIKPRIPTTQDVLDRRARKNAQSRARAAKLRERIAIIEQKPDSERNEEEMQIFAQ